MPDITTIGAWNSNVVRDKYSTLSEDYLQGIVIHYLIMNKNPKVIGRKILRDYPDLI